MVGGNHWFGGLFGMLFVAALSDCAARGQPAGAPHFEGDTGASYSELDEAAVAACQWLWSHEPDAKTHEYCGVLYRDGNEDEIHVGLPERGDQAYSCLPSAPPKSAVMLGRYHNHRFGAEPSGPDRAIARALPALGHYLCGPSGIVRRISAKEGTVNVR